MWWRLAASCFHTRAAATPKTRPPMLTRRGVGYTYTCTLNGPPTPCQPKATEYAQSTRNVTRRMRADSAATVTMTTTLYGKIMTWSGGGSKNFLNGNRMGARDNVTSRNVNDTRKKLLLIPIAMLLWQNFSLFITFSDVHFFHDHLLIKLIGRLLSRNGKTTMVYNEWTFISGISPYHQAYIQAHTHKNTHTERENYTRIAVWTKLLKDYFNLLSQLRLALQLQRANE